MIDATISMWRDAEINLLRSPQHREDMKEVLSLFKFIFDKLEDDNIKNCLLYCCLFKEEKISKDSLKNFWFVEGKELPKLA